MPETSCARDALSLLFKRDGVPSSMVMDGSKEQNLVNLLPSADRLAAMLNRQNLTLPGTTLVRLLSKNVKVQLVGTYVLVSAPRSSGMIALKEGLT